MRFEAVLLDLDGTLVDSARDLMEALNRVLAGQGLRRVDLDETRSMIGDGARVLLERALVRTGSDPARAGELLPVLLDHYGRQATTHTRPYPGVPETLAALRARGLKLAVVTNKPEAATHAVLGDLALAPLLDAVVGGDTLPRRKPDPAPVLLGCGLFAAAFFSDKSGHDDAVTWATTSRRVQLPSRCRDLAFTADGPDADEITACVSRGFCSRC